MKNVAKLILSLLILAIGLGALLVANPLNWFVKKSPDFSRERFESVQAGMTAESLVDLLGEPVRITEPEIPDQECEGCLTYYFMGDPPQWLPGHQEAWVYVGPDGLVKDKVWHTEP